MINSMLETMDASRFKRSSCVPPMEPPFLIRRIGTLFPNEHFLAGECSFGKRLTTNNKSLMVMYIYHLYRV